jgi:hypothetical protein
VCFQHVWCASESRLRSRSKVLVYDDVGTLTIDGGAAEFRGPKLNFALSDLEEPQLVRQSMPWIAYLAANVLLLPAHAIVVFVLQSLLKLDAWRLYFAFVLLCNALGLLVGFSTMWVRISGKSNTGKQSNFFVADASQRGWGGIMGGTRRLLEQACRPTR